MDDADRLNYATPTLMRAARGAYAQSIRAQLHAIGADDLPRNGVFVLAGIDPAGQVEAMRVVLATLAEIKVTGLETGTGLRRPARQFRQFSPIFPVSDMAAALAHYTGLGFATLAYRGGADYGFANRDGTGLHLVAGPGREAGQHSVAAYLYVRDADALYEEWSRPGTGGQTRPAVLMEYGLREGLHIDPDGNELRFGSPADDE